MNRVMKLKNTLIDNPVLSALISVNIIGTLFGIYYYIPQLLSTDTFFWPLIPDSPTATFLFVLSLIILFRNDFEKSGGLKNILYSLAFVGNVKYGLWTVYVLLEFMPHFTSVNSSLMYFFLLISHLGMFLQAFLLLPYIQHGKEFVIAPLFYLFNDIVDYTFQIHTSLPEAQYLGSKVAFVAYGLTISSFTLIWFKNSLNLSSIRLLEKN